MERSILQYDPLNDYQLILDLPPAAKKKIAAVKTEFDLDYRGTPIGGGQPFVYLATFAQPQSAERTVIDRLHQVALGFMPFKIHFKNFNHLDTTEIYADIELRKPVELLTDKIKAIEKLVKTARFNNLPRITIAKNLQPFQFEKSWKQYAKKPFSVTFIAAEMLLLKRMEGFSSWQILQHMPFQNMALV